MTAIEPLNSRRRLVNLPMILFVVVDVKHTMNPRLNVALMMMTMTMAIPNNNNNKTSAPLLANNN